MHAHLEQDLSLEDLAAVANASISHLVRQWKQQTGLPPHQYLLRLRVERAKMLIHCGSMSLKEIAHRLGFADQAHFTKKFKRMTGETPMQYSKR
ncbi:helix-turn-helix domain-containing protein [Brevibacillus borstelensis]|uniref:helix-turn-helix domain-containing protein n=1 Tax=Brevibacillus borstelensis TaxID=45462 RepID=UPI0030C12E7C